MSRRLRSLAAAAVLLVLAAAPLSASTVWYVRGNARGNTSGGCGTFALPCRYIDGVNGKVQPGDEVNVDSLNIAVASDSTGNNRISPINNGTSTSRIRYYTPATSPPWSGLYAVPSVILERSNITVSGFRIRAGVDFQGPKTPDPATTKKGNANRLLNSFVMGDVSFRGAQDCRVEGNAIRGKIGFVCENGQTQCGTYTAQDPAHPGDGNYGIATFISGAIHDTLRKNDIDFGIINHACCDPSPYGPRSGMLITCVTQYCVIDTNQFRVMFAPPFGTDEGWTLIMYGASSNQFKDNHYTSKSTAITTTSTHEALRIRNASRFNSFTRDTFDFGWDAVSAANGPWMIHLSASSIDTLNDCWPHGQDGSEVPRNNTFDRCVFRTRGTTGYGFALKAQQGLTNYVIKDCEIRSLAMGGLGAMNASGGQLLNNTIASKVRPLTFESTPSTGGPPPRQMTIKGNLFYADSVTAAEPYVMRLENLPIPGDNNVINQNLYYSRAGQSGDGSRRRYAIGRGSSYRSPVDPDSIWCTQLGYDCSSAWADPLFAQVVFDTTFDAHLRAGSSAACPALWPLHPGAIAHPCDSAYVGAYAARDTTPPAVPYDFTATCLISQTTIEKTYSWIMTGDDSMSCQADSVFLAESPPLVPLTPANFATWTIYRGAAQAPGVRYVHNCRMGPDDLNATECGTDAITAPNLIGNVQVRVKDNAGNYGYSRTILVTTPQ